MKVAALIMAGGRGTRMGRGVEKPLLKVRGKPMLGHVLGALRRARSVERVAVAVSDYTPKTARLARKLSLRVLKTPGRGYVEDMRQAIRKLGPGPALVIGADMPLLKGSLIDRIVSRYEICGKPAMTVVIPAEQYKRLGAKPEYEMEAGGMEVVPAGINLLDGSKITQAKMEEELMVLKEVEALLNVNTPEELELAERILCSQCKGQGPINYG